MIRAIPLALRRILLLAIPALLLIAALWGRGTIPLWIDPVVAAQPGEVLLAATFDGEGDDPFNRDWDQDSGRLSTIVTDGAMRVTIEQEVAGAYSAANVIFTDFDMTVTGTTLNEPIDNGYGVVFRLQDKGNRAFGDDDYYLFLISSDGYYRFSRVIEGGERIVSDWIPSDAIAQGVSAENRLRVRAEGDSFAFWINGTRAPLCIPNDPAGRSTYFNGECLDGALIETVTDALIPSGRIGVGAISTQTGGAGVSIAFDDLVVTVPSADSPAA